MGCGDNFSTDMSEWLHIAIMKEAYRSTNKANYICQILKHNDWCTGFDHMEETLSYLALPAWYNIHSVTVFDRLSATDRQQSARRGHPFRLPTIEQVPIVCPVSQQVYHFRETHVSGVYRCIKLTSHRNISANIGIPNFGQLFHAQNEEAWEQKVSRLVLGYDLNVHIGSIFLTLQNAVLYSCQPFHKRTSVQHLGLDCKVEYTNANQGIVPEAHNIWVQDTQSEENDLDNTLQ